MPLAPALDPLTAEHGMRFELLRPTQDSGLDEMNGSLGLVAAHTGGSDAVKRHRTHVSFMMDVIGAVTGLLKPPPESTSGAMPGEAPVPSKPQPHLTPAPGHPLFMQPPGVRAALFASIAKKKMVEAQEHAEIARKESDKADMEWRKSLSFATEAAARRDACMKYQYHASLVRSLNRLVGFGARSEVLLQEGKGPNGDKLPEVAIADDMVLLSSRQLEGAKADVKSLEHTIKRMEEAEGYDDAAGKVKGILRKLVQQEKKLQEIHDDLVHAQGIIHAQVPESHEPPILPKRLLKPDGEPWWPERPPHPVSGNHRLMLVKAFSPAGASGTLHGSAGTKFL